MAIPAAAYLGYKALTKNKNKSKTSTPTYQTQNTNLQNFQTDLWNRLQASRGAGDAARGNLTQGFTDLMSRPGYSSANRGRFEDFANTGGIDPTKISADAQSLRDFGKQGGHKFFGELAETGGWDPQRTSDFRGRIAAQTPSFYSSLRDNLAHKNRIQGGYGTGFQEADAKLARESAHGSQDAVREGELSMGADKIQNQLAGATGYSQNFLSGLQGAMGGELSLQNLIQQGKEYGISGMEQADQYGDQSGYRNMSGGLSGLLNLFGTRDAESAGMEGNYLGSIGTGANIEQDYWQRAQADKARKDQWIQRILGLISGGVSSALTGEA